MRPTCDVHLIPGDLTLQVNTSPPFGEISSTQAGHIHNTLVMNIHITGWRDKEMKDIREQDLMHYAFDPTIKQK